MVAREHARAELLDADAPMAGLARHADEAVVERGRAADLDSLQPAGHAQALEGPRARGRGHAEAAGYEAVAQLALPGTGRLPDTHGDPGEDGAVPGGAVRSQLDAGSIRVTLFLNTPVLGHGCPYAQAGGVLRVHHRGHVDLETRDHRIAPARTHPEGG